MKGEIAVDVEQLMPMVEKTRDMRGVLPDEFRIATERQKFGDEAAGEPSGPR